MRIRFANALFTAVAVGVGALTLAAYFVDALAGVRAQFLAWGSLLAAVSVLIGVLNLLRVHIRKMTGQTPGWPYSLFTFLGFFFALTAALAAFLPGQDGPTTNVFSRFLFQHVIGAVGASLSALLVFILVFAGYRLMRRPPTLLSVVFLITAAASLIAMAPQVVGLPDFGLRDAWLWLSQAPAAAGARGLVLGIALGIVATGLRVLLAWERPYGD